MKTTFFFKFKLHQLLAWLLVAAAWYFLRYEDYPTTRMALLVTFIKVADFALMVYTCNLILIPYLLYRKKYLLFGFAFIGMVFFSSVIKMDIIANVIGEPSQKFSFSGNLKMRIYDNVIPHFFLVAAGALVKLMFDYSTLQKRMINAAKEKAEAELNFLKSQVNPHFLFNSLNSVYFLIDKNNTDARSSLHKFSEMLRYQLYEMNGKTVPVEKEIDYLKDYVDLQKLRKGDQYSINFEHSDKVSGFSIEPLLLIPFVENAFKHISHEMDRKNYVDIRMDCNNGVFNISVANSCNGKGRTDESGGGIGLKNVKRRLELLYPGKYKLEINNTGTDHFVKLSLQLS